LTGSKKNLACSVEDKRRAIEPGNDVISVSRQCVLMGLPRSSYYYQPCRDNSYNERLMRKMGLMAVVPGPHTSRPHPEHNVYQYLLRNLDINRADQVWAADITYIRMSKGFLYLVAIMDWFSRYVLSWRLSNRTFTCFC
jgi:putative transposase